MRRLLVGLEGPSITAYERRLFRRSPPFGVILLPHNLASAPQVAALVEETRSLADPAPLLFVDQEGEPVDRIGPLLSLSFPSASECSQKGTDFVHECAYLMGRAARLLGFDVDLAPVVDLGQPGTGAVILAGRTFGFHAEDVALAGMVFLHGLARAGLASCLKHFPGLGRGSVDSHVSPPVIDAHDVDLMVTDVAPFRRLHRMADGILVGHGAYPGITGEPTPASISPRIHEVLRSLGFEGLSISDDLAMGALEGPLPERAEHAARAGCDVLCLSGPFGAYEEAIARVAALEPPRGLEARLAALQRRCAGAPRPSFSEAGFDRLADEAQGFLSRLASPREQRGDSGSWDPEKT